MYQLIERAARSLALMTFRGGVRLAAAIAERGHAVLLRDHCAICGVRRRTDTYAQRPDTGERGLTSVAYFAPEGE